MWYLSFYFLFKQCSLRWRYMLLELANEVPQSWQEYFFRMWHWFCLWNLSASSVLKLVVHNRQQNNDECVLMPYLVVFDSTFGLPLQPLRWCRYKLCLSEKCFPHESHVAPSIFSVGSVLIANMQIYFLWCLSSRTVSNRLPHDSHRVPIGGWSTGSNGLLKRLFSAVLSNDNSLLVSHWVRRCDNSSKSLGNTAKQSAHVSCALINTRPANGSANVEKDVMGQCFFRQIKWASSNYMFTFKQIVNFEKKCIEKMNSFFKSCANCKLPNSKLIIGKQNK